MRGVRPLLAAGAALLASPAVAETLADAIASAYRGNPTLEGSRYDLRAADEDVVQAKSELRPTVSLNATGTLSRFYPGSSVSPFDPSRSQLYNTNSGQAQLTVAQPLYSGGRASADRAVAEAGVRAGREALRGAEGDVLLGVITAYVDVRRYERALAVWQTSVAELDRLGKEIAARQVAGELTRTDVAQAQAQIAIAHQQVALTEQNLQAARADYAALVGHDPGTLDDPPPLPQLPQNVDTAFDMALRESPDLARTRYAELGSRADIAVAKSQGRPTLALRGSGAVSGDAEPWRLTREDRGYSASVVLTAPISAGGRIASQVRQAEDRNGADRARIEEARRALMRNVVNAWNGMVTAERVAVLLDDQRRAATIQLDGMINEYRVGLRSTFDVLYAQQSLRDAEVASLQSLRDRYVAEATLLRRSGLLEARALMTGVRLYDPAAHLRAVADRNAVPWEGLIAALDKAGKPGTKQKPLVRPGLPTATPAVLPASHPAPGAAAPLARTTPTAPIPGTAGRSTPLPKRKPL